MSNIEYAPISLQTNSKAPRDIVLRSVNMILAVGSLVLPIAKVNVFGFESGVSVAAGPIAGVSAVLIPVSFAAALVAPMIVAVLPWKKAVDIVALVCCSSILAYTIYLIGSAKAQAAQAEHALNGMFGNGGVMGYHPSPTGSFTSMMNLEPGIGFVPLIVLCILALWNVVIANRSL